VNVKWGRFCAESIYRAEGVLGVAGRPVGPPQRTCVVAGPLEGIFLEMIQSVPRYPNVIATTRSAPCSLGGLGRGISTHLHVAPMTRDNAQPIASFTILKPLNWCSACYDCSHTTDMDHRFQIDAAGICDRRWDE
jgi:hypothetical protein